MNYYFFIDFNEIGLRSSIDIFNFPPISKLYKQKIKDKKIFLFYSDNDKWNYLDFGIIKKNSFVTITKDELPKNLIGKSIFLYLSDLDNNFDLEDQSNYTNTIPEWRCNIKIFNKNTSCSYQGEYPGLLIKRDLSIVSCSPMIQGDKNVENFFILVNLNKDPVIQEFEFEILDSKKNILDKTVFKTNTVNKYSLKNLNLNNSEKRMLIFRSEKKGGIPLYFSKTFDNKSMSLEHTHPPQAYFIFGDTLKFQKFKKKFWFN